MGMCVFQTEQVLPLAQHALSSPEHSAPYGGPDPGPGLFFVHDQGVYLMSNGQPRDTEGGQNGRARVAYAEGCDPTVGEFDDWYSNSRDLVGGDDFAEFLTFSDSEEFLRNCVEFEEFFVNVTATQLSAGFRKQKRRSRARSRA